MKSHGFTLTEVAILLVIVALLVAIAVPNFRLATIKSKEALALGQLNVIALALESYYMDYQSYPLTAYTNPVVPTVADDGGSSHTSYFTLKPLTTPIAYVTRIPEDPFAEKPIPPTFDQGYGRYGHINAGFAYRNTQGSNRLTYPAYPQYGQEWQLASVGPNGRYDSWGTTPDNLVFYDPTNGILSNGDIIRMQRSSIHN